MSNSSNDNIKKESDFPERKEDKLDELLEEIRNLVSKRDNRTRGFPITEEQENKIFEWMREHEKTAHGLETLDDFFEAAGAIGGMYRYIFLPTSIGTSGVVQCCLCGEEFEFQEID